MNVFTENVRRKRAELFREFSDAWNSDESTRMFARISDMSPHDLAIPEGAVSKVAIISDVHGNGEALGAVLADASARGAGLCLCCGDLAGFSPELDEVMARLASGHFLSVKGNYDVEMLEWRKPRKGEDPLAEEAISVARDNMGRRTRKRLKSLPDELRILAGGKRILVVHGTPESPTEKLEPGTPIATFKKLAKRSKADVVAFGHTHQPMTKLVEGVLFVNPGSVGRPDDGDPRASYALLDLVSLSVEQRRVEYDVRAQAAKARKQGLPEHVAQMLLRGVSLDKVVAQDASVAGWTKENEPALIEVVKALAKAFDPDPAHSEHIWHLAESLFDSLQAHHGLEGRERYWLQCAALLHDVGWFVAGEGHNKHSLQIILNSQALPFSIRERLIVGGIARYHRGKLPSPKHFHMRMLEKCDRATVVKLASLIRLADALDASHVGAVDGVVASVGGGRLTISCSAVADSDAEREKALLRADLLGRAMGKRVFLDWKVSKKAGAPNKVIRKTKPGKGEKSST